MSEPSFEELAKKAAAQGMTLTQTDRGFVLKKLAIAKMGRDRANVMYPMPGIIKSLKDVARWLDSWEGNRPS